MRRLAAIMFTDIVGYSALMSKDEKIALQILDKNREMQNEVLKRFHGEFIKEIGDGTLSIFQSSWDAVSCAMELQHMLGNSAYYQLRIGIHIGDIVVADRDVFGDGVNIASRIQALCEPGSILVSEKVYDDIRNKSGITAECIGEKELKNIDQPVRIYAISPECIQRWAEESPESEPEVTGSSEIKSSGRRLSPFMKRIILTAGIMIILTIVYFVIRPYLLRAAPDSGNVPIAVISFENQTGDTAFNYLQKAIPNLLITNLEQSKLFQVMTWERMQDVMDQLGKKDVETIDAVLGFDICRKEGCEFIVIGSFVRAGDVFATDAKVLDVETKRIINSVNSKGNSMGSILDSQIDELSKAISRSVGISSRRVETAPMHIQDVTTRSLEAYNYFLKGREAYDKMYYNDAKNFLEKAVKIDPGFAMAWLYLSKIYGLKQLGDLQKRDEALQKAHRTSRRATENEKLAIQAEYAGIIKHDFQLQLDLLLELANRAPRDKRIFYSLGQWYKVNDLPDKAIEEFEKVLVLDPAFGEADNELAYIYFKRGDFSLALEYLEKYSALNPGDANPFDSMGDLLWRMGKLDEAIAKFRRAMEIKSDTWYAAAKMSYIYAMKEDYHQVDHWMKKTLEATPSEGMNVIIQWIIAFMDYLYGKSDQALQLLDVTAATATDYNNDLYYMVSFFLKAFIRYDRGEYEIANADYHTFFSIALAEPTTSIDLDSSVYNYFMGLLHVKMNRLDSAQYYADRIRGGAENPDKNFYLNYLSREIGIASSHQPDELDRIASEMDQPIPDFEDPWVLFYNLPYRRNSLAEAYHHFGQLDKAIAEYERLITFDPSRADRHLINPRYHYYLGILYQEKGMKGKAAEQYRKFLDLWQDADPGFPEPADARKRLYFLNE
ncbi:MAG: adenylate/guanylate cyclase domain-containing protein [Bacteroidales bacterium]|nr:tetratricopeptide repeat protein [Lentimicrobiaceae bacterium]MDD5694435.1 adenylate/guanylate cyclase domain-containing protein [Bacteroidales bacterium]